MTSTAEVVDEYARAGLTLATAESLTAGLLAARLADVPGASSVLRGGLIVYATDLKAELAGVPEEVLAEHGAVSPETASALARGARRRCRADVGVGLTGVAGPDPQEGHPPGTVFVAVDGPGEDHRVGVVDELGGFGEFGEGSAVGVEPPDRAAVRTAAVAHALDALLAAVRERTDGPARCTR